MPSNPHTFRRTTDGTAWTVTVAATGARVGTARRLSAPHVRAAKWSARTTDGAVLGSHYYSRDAAAYALAEHAATEQPATATEDAERIAREASGGYPWKAHAIAPGVIRLIAVEVTTTEAHARAVAAAFIQRGHDVTRDGAHTVTIVTEPDQDDVADLHNGETEHDAPLAPTADDTLARMMPSGTERTLTAEETTARFPAAAPESEPATDVRARLADALADYDATATAWRATNDEADAAGTVPEPKDYERHDDAQAEHAETLAELVRELLASATPIPPATSTDGDTWGWQGTPDDPETGEARDRGPAPEGFGVFAHWSTSHAGINVEVDAPDGLALTVHVNDWRAVAEVIGSGGDAFPWHDEDNEEDEVTAEDRRLAADQEIAAAHSYTVPPGAGSPPFCSCGVVGGNGTDRPGDRPLLATHLRDVGHPDFR